MKTKLILFGLFALFAASLAAQNPVQSRGVTPPRNIRNYDTGSDRQYTSKFGQMLGVRRYSSTLGDTLVGFVPVYYLGDSTLKVGTYTVLHTGNQTLFGGITASARFTGIGTSASPLELATAGPGGGSCTLCNLSTDTYGRVTSRASGTVNLGTQVSGTLPPTNGGTGIASYAVGDLLYANTTTSLAKLAAGTNGYVLTLASGVPTWAAASGGTITNVVRDTVTATSHGLSIPSHGFLPVRRSGGGYVAANTASASNLPESYVVAIPDANTLVLQQSGRLDVSHGLTAGLIYYLTDAGGVSTTADSDGDSEDFNVVVATTTNTTGLFLMSQRHATNAILTLDDGVNTQVIKTGTTSLLGQQGIKSDVSTTGQIRLYPNFHTITELTTATNSNIITLYDEISGQYRRMTRANFLSGAGSNMANTDLTLSANRSHSLVSNDLNFGGTGSANLLFMSGVNGRIGIGRNSTTSTQTVRFSVNGASAFGTYVDAPTNGIAVSGDVKIGSVGGVSSKLFLIYSSANTGGGIYSYITGGNSNYARPNFTASNTESPNAGQIALYSFDMIDSLSASLKYHYGVRKETRNWGVMFINNEGTERVAIGRTGRGIGLNTSTNNPFTDVNIGGTLGLAIPSGTTAQRSGTPVAGTVRRNTTTGVKEWHNGSRWVLGEKRNYIYISTSSTIDPTSEQYTVICNASSGAITATLPTPTASHDGVIVHVKQVNSATNAVTVTTTGGSSVIYDDHTLTTTSTVAASGSQKSYQCMTNGENYFWFKIAQ
jgi:hypothetical protein